MPKACAFRLLRFLAVTSIVINDRSSLEKSLTMEVTEANPTRAADGSCPCAVPAGSC